MRKSCKVVIAVSFFILNLIFSCPAYSELITFSFSGTAEGNLTSSINDTIADVIGVPRRSQDIPVPISGSFSIDTEVVGTFNQGRYVYANSVRRATLNIGDASFEIVRPFSKTLDESEIKVTNDLTIINLNGVSTITDEFVLSINEEVATNCSLAKYRR